MIDDTKFHENFKRLKMLKGLIYRDGVIQTYDDASILQK
jgi:hypothetical protein